MIAKNFYKLGNSIFYPQYDIGGSTEGIIPTEFPIFNYIISLLYHVFGLNNWSGRLINWLISCLSLYFLYGLVKKIFNKDIALYTILLYACSIAFMFARKTMPDTFSLSLVIIGSYYYWEYISQTKTKHLLIAFIITSLGILSKIPSICFLFILLFPILDKSYPIKNKIITIISLTLSTGLVCYWYFSWMPYLELTYGNKLIWPVSLKEGFNIFKATTQEVLFRFKVTAFHYNKPYYFSLIGLLLLLKDKKINILIFFTLYSFLFFIFILKTGNIFYQHNYYVIPYIPIMAILAAYAINKFKVIRFLPLIVVLLLIIKPIKENRKDALAKYSYHYTRLKGIIDKLGIQDNKLMVNGDFLNPTMMYFTQEKGWSVNNNVLFKTEWMPDFKKKDGIKYIIVDRHKLEDTLVYTLIYEDDDFRVYKP